MTSRERMLAAIAGETPDHVPLYCWAFGFTAPAHLRWRRRGREVSHWYTMRLEHIHALPQPWSLEDDFARVRAWLSLGVDDVLDVSVPWAFHREVRVRDWVEPPTSSEPHPRLHRRYETPAGPLDHVVRATGEDPGPGWVVQPDHVALFEDFNIPRGVRHALTAEEDLPRLAYLLGGPDDAQVGGFREQMEQVGRFAREQGVLTQAWTAFGMDGIVWLMGVEGAVLAAVQEPRLFEEAVRLMAEFDRRRTEVALAAGGVDMVVQRGWYSSTDFWSPALFRRYVLPHLRQLVDITHQAGAEFAYVMTTGLEAMADLLGEVGIDLLYFVDPVQDRVDLDTIRARIGGRFALAGGVNSGVTLASGDEQQVRGAVRRALQALGPAGFVLSPVDALFPDTPCESVKSMIDEWRRCQAC